MLSLGKMVQYTDRDVKSKASSVGIAIKVSKIDIDDEDKWYKLISGVSRPSKKGLPHKFTLKIYGKGTTVRSKAWVHCNCPYFLFNCEVALSLQGSSTVVNSNGRRPRIMNPGMRPKLCKHLMAAARLAIQKKPKTGALPKDLKVIPKEGRVNLHPKDKRRLGK